MFYSNPRNPLVGVVVVIFSAFLGLWPSDARLQTTSLGISPGSYTVSMKGQTLAVLCLPESQLTPHKLVHELMRSQSETACQLKVSSGASGYQSTMATCNGSPQGDERSRILSSSVVDNSLKVSFQTRSQYNAWSDTDKQEVTVTRESAAALKFRISGGGGDMPAPMNASATRTGECNALSVLPIQRGLYSLVGKPGRKLCVAGDAISAFDIVRTTMDESCQFQSKAKGNKLDLLAIECPTARFKLSMAASVIANEISLDIKKPAKMSAKAWEKSGLVKTQVLKRTGDCD